MKKGTIVERTYAPGRGPREPIGLEVGKKEGGAVEPRQIKIMFNVQGRPPSSWDELHRRALVHDDSNDLAWLLEFTARISGACECQRHWVDLLKRMEPDFTNYFAWTVAAHNDVNRRLKKPEVSLAEALQIWGSPNVDTPAKLNPPPQ